MRLSPHFFLTEVIPGGVREADVPPEVVAKLEILATELLEPIRAAMGTAMVITSGWRPPGVNEAAGGVPMSDHKYGRAADFFVTSGRELDSWEARTVKAYDWARLNLRGRFGQLILEDHRDALNNRAKLWVHIAIPSERHPGHDDANALLISHRPGHYEAWTERLA